MEVVPPGLSLTITEMVIRVCGRLGGLMVSVLDSGSRVPGSRPGRDIVLCSWARHFALTVPLSRCINGYQQTVRETLMKFWEVTCDGLASHPGGIAIFLVT